MASSEGWRGEHGDGCGVGSSRRGAPPLAPAPSLEPLHAADATLRNHCTLSLYVPVEQVGVVIGKKGAKIKYIQSFSTAHVNVEPAAEDSVWCLVLLRGSPSGCLTGARLIAGMVEELDDCVAQFPLPRNRQVQLIGKGGATIRSISADSNVRIYVPSKKDEGSTDVQLEGELEDVFKAVAKVVEAAYGGGGKEPPPPSIEEELLVTVAQLRLLAQGKTNAMMLVGRHTGTRIKKAPKANDDGAGKRHDDGPSPTPTVGTTDGNDQVVGESQAEEDEGVEAGGGLRGLLGVEAVSQHNYDALSENSSVAATAGTASIGDKSESKDEDEDEDDDEEGAAGGQGGDGAEPGDGVAPKSGDRNGGGDGLGKQEAKLVRILVRGTDEKAVLAALDALRKVAEGHTSLSEVVAGLKNEFPAFRSGSGGGSGRGGGWKGGDSGGSRGNKRGGGGANGRPRGGGGGGGGGGGSAPVHDVR